MSELNKELLEQTKGVAVEVYKDAVSPIVKPIGEILGFLPRTIKLALSGWEKWIINGEESLRLTAEAIKEKVKMIPEEKLVEPEPYVAIPAIQQISYCQNSEELRDLYANLLTASMNADTKWQVHPAFIDIIKQITPDEAKIIKNLPDKINDFLPALDVILFDKERISAPQLLLTNFATIGLDIVENKTNICRYLDNLVRLNIIDFPTHYGVLDDGLYEPLIQSELLDKIIPDFNRSIYALDYNCKVIVITNFGLSFKKICCS